MDPLREWVVSHGAKVSDKIVAQAIPSMGGGMGVVATAPIAAGAVLVSIPMKLMLTTKRARAILGVANPASTFSSKALAALSPVEAIVSALLHIRNRTRLTTSSSGSTDDNSLQFFAPWIDILPPQYDNLIEIPEGHVKSLLPHLHRYQEKVVSEIHNWQAMATKLSSEKNATPQMFSLGSATAGAAGQLLPVSPRDFIWAYNSLMSRGFSYDDEIWAMMPWVDYFNYDREPNLTMTYNNRTKTYDFFTKYPVQVGEQLCLKYGDYSDFEIATWYGFTLSNIPSAIRSEDDVDILVSYAFSPLADVNGMKPHDYPDYDADSTNPNAWVVELIQTAGLSVPESFLKNGGRPMEDVRVCARGISNGMCKLLRMVGRCNKGVSEGEILQRLAAAELTLAEKKHANDGDEAATIVAELDLERCVDDNKWNFGAAAGFAKHVDTTMAALLKQVSTMDAAEVTNVVENTTFDSMY